MAPNPFRQNLDYNERQDRLKKNHRHRSRLALFEKALEDNNNLTDPMAGQITPIPFPPAEPAPIGILDGIYPQEDQEGKPVANLYYGIMETHMADDGENDDE
jgi:hypothetical protein